MRIAAVALSAFFSVFLIAVTPATAQRLPGVPGADVSSTSRHRAAYVAQMNGEVRSSVRDWRSAWNSDELESLSDIYSENALLILPEGGFVRGRDPIKRHFEENLPLLGRVQLSQSDFHASGRMAFMSGPFSYNLREMTGTVRQVTGVHVTVFLRKGRHWKIRSQIFKAEAN